MKEKILSNVLASFKLRSYNFNMKNYKNIACTNFVDLNRALIFFDMKNTGVLY